MKSLHVNSGNLENDDDEDIYSLIESPIKTQEPNMHSTNKALEIIKDDISKIDELAPQRVKDFLLETLHSNESDVSMEGYFEKNLKQIEKHIMKQQFLENNKLFDPYKYFGGLNIENLSEGTNDQRLEAMFIEYLSTEQEENEIGNENEDMDMQYPKANQINNNNMYNYYNKPESGCQYMSLKDKLTLFTNKSNPKTKCKPLNSNQNTCNTLVLAQEKSSNPYPSLKDFKKKEKSRSPNIQSDSNKIHNTSRDKKIINRRINSNKENIHSLSNVKHTHSKSKIEPQQTRNITPNKINLTKDDKRAKNTQSVCKRPIKTITNSVNSEGISPKKLKNNIPKTPMTAKIIINNTTSSRCTDRAKMSRPRSNREKIKVSCFANNIHSNTTIMGDSNDNIQIKGGSFLVQKTPNPALSEDNPSPLIKSVLRPYLIGSAINPQKYPICNSVSSHLKDKLNGINTTASKKNNNPNSILGYHLKIPKNLSSFDTFKISNTSLGQSLIKKSNEFNTLQTKNDRCITDSFPNTHKMVAHIIDKFQNGSISSTSMSNNSTSTNTSFTKNFARKLFCISK